MTTLNLRRFSSYFSRLPSLKWTAMPPSATFREDLSGFGIRPQIKCERGDRSYVLIVTL